MNSRKARILIVDDTPQNIQVLGTILEKNDYEIMIAQDGFQALKTVNKAIPDLILLDIMMPHLDGIETCIKLKESQKTKDIPIIFLTALTETEDIVKGFELGAVDYITKPFNSTELLVRVRTHLTLKEQTSLLKNRELQLIKLVDDKTKKIEGMTFALINALENANLLNDDDTGNHIKRVSNYSAILANGYGCDHEYVKKIKLYSSLHDVGKVALPDKILKKSDRLTKEEFELMKEHVVFGYNMLNNEELEDMPKKIAYYHHERWDGSGYVHQLEKEKIPLEARIVTLADVYDALVSKRVYKEAYSQEKAEEIIKKESEKIFDPKLVEIFFANIDELLTIKTKYQ